MNKVMGAVLLDQNDVANQVVVAGIHKPIDGHCLFAFDVGGHVRWRIDLSADRQWPDCLSPARFQAHCVVRGNLNGDSPDEIVVSAGDWLEYPTRVSIIDPQTQEIQSTFWHAGHLNDLLIIPGFFDDYRPAIVARGMNNKLDGFDDGSHHDDLPLADYDVVSVLMILDPEGMDGLGPVLSRRFPNEKAAALHAYVFLNLAHNDEVLRVSHVKPNGRRVEERLPDDLPREELGVVDSVERAQRDPVAGTGPWFEVAIMAKTKDETWGRAYLVVDRNLNLRSARAVNVGGEIAGDTVEYWNQYWTPVPTENANRSGHGGG